jgi:hypothetical protein
MKYSAYTMILAWMGFAEETKNITKKVNSSLTDRNFFMAQYPFLHLVDPEA